MGEDNGALRSEAWTEEDWFTWVEDGEAESEDNGRLSREDKDEYHPPLPNDADLREGYFDSLDPLPNRSFPRKSKYFKT